MKDNHLVDMNIYQTAKLSLVGALLLALTSCGGDQRTPGRTFVPDMAYSQAYETYTKNPVFGKDSLAGVDSLAARKPVAGSISRGLLPMDTDSATDGKVLASYLYSRSYANDSASYADAGENLKNPFQPTKEVLEQGKKIYTIHCLVCHGEKGLGNGSIVQTEAYPPVVSYVDRLPTINEGQMFHSITYGRNLMGSYSYALNAEDRWKVIYYIQQLVNVGPFKNEGTVDAAATTPAADTTAVKN
jgi:mono/diheme cytochrome c family protein